MEGKLKVVDMPVRRREQDSSKLTKRQKSMLTCLKEAEKDVREGRVRSLLVVRKNKRTEKDKGCFMDYSVHDADDLLIMGYFMQSAAMKSPMSAEEK